MRNYVAPVILVVLLGVPAVRAQESLDAKGFVDSVLKLYDQRKYEELYSKGSSGMKQLMSAREWNERVVKIEKLAGKNVSRFRTTTSKSAGTYRFTFDSQYTEGRVFEDIFVVNEDGVWKLAGFAVRPNFNDDPRGLGRPTALLRGPRP
jgi:hypothetical protein